MKKSMIFYIFCLLLTNISLFGQVEYEPARPEKIENRDQADRLGKDAERRKEEARAKLDELARKRAEAESPEDREGIDKEIQIEQAKFSVAKTDLDTAAFMKEYFDMSKAKPEDKAKADQFLAAKKEQVASVSSHIQDFLKTPKTGLSFDQQQAFSGAINKASSGRRELNEAFKNELNLMQGGSDGKTYNSKLVSAVAYGKDGIPDYQKQLDVLYEMKKQIEQLGNPDFFEYVTRQVNARIAEIITQQPLLPSKPIPGNSVDESLKLSSKISMDQLNALDKLATRFSKESYATPFEKQKMALDMLGAITVYNVDIPARVKHAGLMDRIMTFKAAADLEAEQYRNSVMMIQTILRRPYLEQAGLLNELLQDPGAGKAIQKFPELLSSINERLVQMKNAAEFEDSLRDAQLSTKVEGLGLQDVRLKKVEVDKRDAQGKIIVDEEGKPVKEIKYVEEIVDFKDQIPLDQQNSLKKKFIEIMADRTISTDEKAKKLADMIYILSAYELTTFDLPFKSEKFAKESQALLTSMEQVLKKFKPLEQPAGVTPENIDAASKVINAGFEGIKGVLDAVVGLVSSAKAEADVTLALSEYKKGLYYEWVGKQLEENAEYFAKKASDPKLTKIINLADKMKKNIFGSLIVEKIAEKKFGPALAPVLLEIGLPLAKALTPGALEGAKSIADYGKRLQESGKKSQDNALANLTALGRAEDAKELGGLADRITGDLYTYMTVKDYIAKAGNAPEFLATDVDFKPGGTPEKPLTKYERIKNAVTDTINAIKDFVIKPAFSKEAGSPLVKAQEKVANARSDIMVKIFQKEIYDGLQKNSALASKLGLSPQFTQEELVTKLTSMSSAERSALLSELKISPTKEQFVQRLNSFTPSGKEELVKDYVAAVGELAGEYEKLYTELDAVVGSLWFIVEGWNRIQSTSSPIEGDLIDEMYGLFKFRDFKINLLSEFQQQLQQLREDIKAISDNNYVGDQFVDSMERVINEALVNELTSNYTSLQQNQKVYDKLVEDLKAGLVNKFGR